MRTLRSILAGWRLDVIHLMAILCPPLAVRMCGRADQVFLSISLTLLLWLPGVVHALWLVSIHESADQANRYVAALRSHIGH